MKKIITISIIALASVVSFGQRKVDFRVFAGNTNVLGGANGAKYSQLFPLVGVSFQYGVTDNTYLGLSVQNEWLKREYSFGNITDNSGLQLKALKREVRSSYLTLAIKGTTYLNEGLYFTYSAGYAVNYANNVTGFPGKVENQNKVIISPGLGYLISREWKVSPFIEVTVPTVYIPTGSTDKETIFGLQTKIGIRF